MHVTLPLLKPKEPDFMQRVGVFIVNRKDTWQTNVLLELCLGYLKGQLNIFNQVVEKWGIAQLKLAGHWLAEEAAIKEHS